MNLRVPYNAEELSSGLGTAGRRWVQRCLLQIVGRGRCAAYLPGACPFPPVTIATPTLSLLQPRHTLRGVVRATEMLA
jgi:hypothetical protein